MNRQKAIEEVVKNPDRAVMVIPMTTRETTTEAWVTIEIAGLTREQINHIKTNSKFDVAEKEDLFDCINCGATAAIFENTCPSCGKFPHPDFYEGEADD